jgi:hypothetical protein
MKQVIKPMIVASFLLTAVPVVPGISWYCGVAGLLSLIATYVAGLIIYGTEEKDWTQAMHLLEMSRQKADSDLRQLQDAVAIASRAKIDEMSAALAKLKDEKRRSPLE